MTIMFEKHDRAEFVIPYLRFFCLAEKAEDYSPIDKTIHTRTVSENKISYSIIE